MKTYVPCFIAIAFLAGDAGCASYPVPYARAHAPDKIIVPPMNADKNPIVHRNIPERMLDSIRLHWL